MQGVSRETQVDAAAAASSRGSDGTGIAVVLQVLLFDSLGCHLEWLSCALPAVVHILLSFTAHRTLRDIPDSTIRTVVCCGHA